MKKSTYLSLAWFAALAASPLFAEPTHETLHTASSEVFTVYVAGPIEAHEGIVLAHDWFGHADLEGCDYSLKE